MVKKLALLLSVNLLVCNVLTPTIQAKAQTREFIQEEANLRGDVDNNINIDKNDTSNNEDSNLSTDEGLDENIEENDSNVEEDNDSNVDDNNLQENNDTNVEDKDTIIEEQDKTLKEDNEEAKDLYYEKKVKKHNIKSYTNSMDKHYEKEEYALDMNSLTELEYLVPKTDSEFEVVYAHSDGNFSYVDSAKTKDEAIEKINRLKTDLNDQENIPAIIDKNGVVVYATNAMGRVLKHFDGEPYFGSDINTLIYPNSNLTGVSNYVNQGYVDDVPIIDDKGFSAKIQVAGYEGWIKKDTSSNNYDLIVVPLNQAYNPSYYCSENGQLKHWISGNLSDKNQQVGHFRTTGVAPTWMKSGVKYFSYDSNYFYTSLNALLSDLKNNTTRNAVNSGNPFYNYYLYLPFRTKTSYTASQLDKFINENTGSDSMLRGVGTELVASQNKYGVNAAVMLGIAINESAWGTSYLSKTKNNLFGLGAFDSSPNDAEAFRSVQHCIDEFANYWISKGYGDPQDMRYYGGFLGAKKLGANVKYASDPFWGEKAASYTFMIDLYLSQNNIGSLSDFNNYQLGMYTKPATVVAADGSTLYEIRSSLDLNTSYVGVPVALTSTYQHNQNGKTTYRIYPERTTQLLPSGGSEFGGIYDWNKQAYVDVNSIQFINSVKMPTGVNYQTSVIGKGWNPWQSNGVDGANSGNRSAIEAIKIKFEGYPEGTTVSYRSYAKNSGWLSWLKDGQTSGTVGHNNPIQAIQIEASIPNGKELEYRVYNSSQGWLPWVKNGDVAGEYGTNIENVQIRITNSAEKKVFTKGKYEESDSGIRFLGDWSNWNFNNHSGGSSSYSNQSGSAFEFEFEGTGFNLIGSTNNEKGIARVIIDGKLENHVDTYSSSQVYQNTMYTRTGLESGKHTVRVEVAGMKNSQAIGSFINIDAIEILDEEKPKSLIVEDTSNDIKFVGDWKSWTNENHSAGTTRYSNGSNNKIEYTFYGTGIRVLSSTNNEKGIAKILIDGKEYKVDGYTKNQVFKNSIFEINGLSSGKHTITIIVSGQKNSKSNGSYVNFDAFEIFNPIDEPVLEVGKYDENHYGIKTTGDWSRWDNSEHYNGSTIYSNQVGATFEFKFNGTGFAVYGSTNNEKGIAKVTIDGVVQNNFDSYTATRVNQNRIFQRTNLSSGTHTVKIEVTGMKNPQSIASYINIDAVEVLAKNEVTIKKIEESNDSIRYVGNWTQWSDSNHSGGKSIYSNKKGNSIEYNFYGTGIRILGSTNNEKGLLKVYVDGQEYSIDSYTQQQIYQNTLFEITDLKQGKHNIKIVVIDSKNTQAISSYCNFDAFEIIGYYDRPALKPGIYNEDNVVIDYTGSWTNWNTNDHFGGTTKYSNDIGSTIEFTFEGTGFILRGSSNNEKGIGRVVIDGKTENYFDSYNSNRVNKNIIYQRSDLSEGKHTVKIEVTGLKNPVSKNHYINVDSIEVVSNDKIATTRIENTNIDIKYTGKWIDWNHPSHSGGSTNYSNVTNNTIEYTFKGTGIRVIGSTNNEKGLVNIFIDGVQYSVDAFTNQQIYQNNIYEITNLKDGNHTIKIVVTGQKNSKAISNYVNFDAFEIIK